MPRNARIVISGVPRQLTQRGNDRQVVFYKGGGGGMSVLLDRRLSVFESGEEQ